MRFIQALRALLQTWQGSILAILAVLGTIYYGPRKMLETWDWYWERYRDNEVLFVISRRKITHRARGPMAHLNIDPPTVELPFHVREIADYLRRSEKSVEKSINRLKRRGKIEPVQDGWRMR